MHNARHGSQAPASRAPLVVKVGGSLQPRIPGLAPVLRASLRPLLIVPGGGTYANAVREAGLDDEAAHWRAIEAMDTFGHYIASFSLPVTAALAVPGKTTILLPSSCMRRHDPLPHSWDVTSDTIAAWVAAILQGELLLLKSVDGITGAGGLMSHVTTPLETDVTDPSLIPFVLEHRVKTRIINGSHPEAVARYLRGEVVPGTRISITF